MSGADQVAAFWSAEGQVAALSACVVALADALRNPAADDFDQRLSNPDFDFGPVIKALGTGQEVAALLAQTGLSDLDALDDPSLSDTALMIVSQDSLEALGDMLGEVVDALLTLTEVHQLEAQGLWLAQQLSAALQGQMLLLATRDALPVQVSATIRSTAVLADTLSLTVPDLPWTADRWPLADQVSSLQGLGGLMRAFGVETKAFHDAVSTCLSTGYATDALRHLHAEAAIGLEALARALDQWSAEPETVPAETDEITLIQGALARARDVLEQASGE